MVQTHPSTPEMRAQWSAMLLAHQGEYGIVTRLSRQIGVSRPTLYAWRAQAHQALRHSFSPPAPPPRPNLERQILTAWIIHASERGIQTAMRELAQQGLSLATISAVLTQAQQRALDWMHSHCPPGLRALALDEIYANNRQGAYLNVVDVHTGAVWASAGPLSVDSESWTLLLWDLQERGLRWTHLVGDDGAAWQAAARVVSPEALMQQDQWHIWHSCAQVQARLERQWRALEAQTAVVERQAARIAAGQAPKGRRPKTDLSAHLQEVALAHRTVEDVRYLTEQLRRVLDVVVLDGRGLLNASARQGEVETLLVLLAEVVKIAPAVQHTHIEQLHRRLSKVVPQLQTFVPQLEQVQASLSGVLAPRRQALVGWAWLRRKQLGWNSRAIEAALPVDWRDAARVLLRSWDQAVKVSSAVERWHSIMRPHLAVRRSLTPGMLALLAVWHNHRVFTRGIHKGKSPLHLSGMLDAPSDWLVALGYPEAAQAGPPRLTAELLALAA